MKKLTFILFSCFHICLAQSRNENYAATVQQQVWSLTEVMYHDVVNPPAAARFYAYSILTGYEILSQLDPSVKRFQKGLNQYRSISISVDPLKLDKQLAVMYGILETGRNIIPSGYLLEEKEKLLLNEYKKKKIKKDALDSSVSFAKKISAIIVQYAKTDGYFRLSTLPRYKPLAADSNWHPTPPEYMAAVEPHWQSIRKFFSDVSYIPIVAPPVPFSADLLSPFMRMAKEVYTTGSSLSDEQKLIANFWDCNPFAVQFQGHMSIGLKKISPGGHWMGITGIVCNKARLDFASTMLLHTVVALALHDAFVCCWKEKYESNRVRPETVINRYIDEKWKPFLQTPPFPEYVSGHSVISTTAAELLSCLLGDNFSFTDTTESYIGLPARNFSSFKAAAAEARISRLYGGIHFRDAIENGAEQGKELGEFIVKKLQLTAVK
ncbi:MAG TPA: vanadium-dependent haloperoxidase [Chitinophagaceae bacterium]|jgi:hypothetical protein|nr:vanadium-dependent haloperoxidase [Chitinophagaceae bacterium]